LSSLPSTLQQQQQKRKGREVGKKKKKTVRKKKPPKGGDGPGENAVQWGDALMCGPVGYGVQKMGKA